MGAKVKSLIKEKLPNIVLFIVLDFFMLLIASKLSILMRFDFLNVPELYMHNAQRFIILDFIILFIIYSILKLYTSVWKYASVIELIDIILSNIAFIAITSIYKSIFLIKLPISFYLIEFFLLVMLTCITRLGYRVIRTFCIKVKNRKNSKKTMLIGAGDAGRMIIDEIYNNAEAFDSKIVCVIDDNRSKVGHYIKGFKIEGSTKDIERLAKKHEVEEIIIAIPSASKERIDKIVTECHKVECEIKILPSIYMQMEENEKVSPMSQIRPLSYEDFLGRDQIVVDDTQIKNDLADKVILVTGGGGSIGSELCRQIAKANPKTLIIFDIYENNAYDIQQELLRKYPSLDLRTIIGSVRDYDRLEKVFKKFKPDLVYHAAAHKHVPLMEVSPYEAIKNNSFGTLNTVKLADKYKVKKFVLISTDKAVRPTNVMGASKRICEMIVQTYDKISKNTDYVAVRFGNVLGSNGSVIPLFLKQIENGGPVTVTDEKMERFFMTIPEAVSLVLQAGCYAKGGEIFVLDMGKPVRIKALAEKLIRYKGLEPNKDIEIKITGLRPGEKLYEERLMEEEGMQTTPNKLISIGKPLNIPESFLKDLDDLIKSAYNNDDEIKDKVAKIVTTYKVDKERIGK
ncbi:MAG: polysaccharide biosynthesis protein [Clostridiales bacterium]|jgi:hypothetical protein|nr:polysaccharide biosynthesis protein [Clostridiales bacterium]